ncbi:MAG: PilW family protein [Marinobacter sp.]|nr:PilW family protein [Marinobacter sp.]
MLYRRQFSSVLPRQQGFSLVELMISLVLGLLLSAGVVTVFLSSKKAYQTQDAVSQIQENARFAEEFIARDTRMAGYSGCSNEMPTANVIQNAGANVLNFDRGIEGFDGDSGTIPTMFSDALAGSDVLVIHQTELNSELVVTKHNPNSAQIDVTNPHTFKPGTIMMIVDANCSGRGIFVVTGPTNNNGNATNVVHNTGNTFSYSDGSSGVGNCTKSLKGNFDCSNLSAASNTAYTDGSSVFALNTIAFYIQDPAKNTALTSPTLYKVTFSDQFSTGSSTLEPLVEGVSDLDILYGVWSNGKMNYKSANNINSDEWGDVRSVRLELSAESLTDVEGGAPLTRSFVRTIKLRNRS